MYAQHIPLVRWNFGGGLVSNIFTALIDGCANVHCVNFIEMVGVVNIHGNMMLHDTSMTKHSLSQGLRRISP